MNTQKQLWEKLAKENSKYYINSDYGKRITEDQFDNSGSEDFNRLIRDDKLMWGNGDFIYSIILDIGCGTGRLTEYMAITHGEAIGIDISGEMIKQAKERLSMYKNLKFIETDGYTIPLEDNSIDVTFSYLVFQHFKTMEMVVSNFKEVYRVLKPGGLFKVRVRTDKVNTDKWWGGVACDEKVALKAGFKLLKKEPVADYGLWLWLEK